MSNAPTQIIHITGNCEECSKPVDRRVPVLAGGRFGDLLIKHYREQGTGEVPVYCDRHEQDSEERKEIQRQRERRLEQRYDHAGVPARFREIDYEDFTEVEEGCVEGLAEARAIVAGEGSMPGVYLWGEIGVGKTMVLGYIATAMVRRQVRVRWLDVARLLTDLRAGFNTRAYKRAVERLDPAEPGEVLVLNDIDKALATDREVQPLYVAIEEWTNAGNPILVSANLHLDHLAVHFGETFGKPIASRLVGVCTEFEMIGRDRRLDDVPAAA
jgi:DNA replication protein DnaC